MTKAKYHHGDLKNALITAGIEILAKEGAQGLSLRKVARRAGVSHAAPYAHYADKQALIAAIATEGYRQLHDSLLAICDRYHDEPLRQLVECTWAYVQFAQHDPDHFRFTFAGVVEREQDHPALVELTQRSFGLVVQIVARCQAAGILRPGPSDALAVSVWGLAHGLAVLLLGGQISHTVLERQAPRELLLFALSQICLVELEVGPAGR